MTSAGALDAERRAAAAKVHAYLVERHWRSPNLQGPDPGVRFNYRIGRFLKSATRWHDWGDDMVYLQSQGYWVLANWRLAELAAGAEAGAEAGAAAGAAADAARALALAASDGILAAQDADGGWAYPNPAWRGRVATAEGTWASLGLLASFRNAGDGRYLDAAVRWQAYVCSAVDFQRRGDALAVNYFAGRTGPRVPNNTAFYLRFLAELAHATGEADHLARAPGLVSFLAEVQTASGEFPYSVEGDAPGRQWPHFQCFQYNAFMALDLIHYGRLSGDVRAFDLALRTLAFLKGGLQPSGYAAYACDEPFRTVTYHTAVLAAAFEAGADLGLDGCRELARRAYGHVVGRQLADGSFPHSRGDYRVLADNRAYPRYLAMILYHLLPDRSPER